MIYFVIMIYLYLYIKSIVSLFFISSNNDLWLHPYITEVALNHRSTGETLHLSTGVSYIIHLYLYYTPILLEIY